MISEFLFLEEDATKDEKSNYVSLKIEIRQLLKDDFNRKVLSEILLDLRRDISGEAQQTLFKLYQDLGLHKDAFAKLSSWRWQVISKGILELTQMEVAESYGFITKFINDKRGTIRKQAEIATVTLRHEGINYFLDTTKYKISEWQQLKLLDVIRNKEDFQPPRFKAWLTSNNKYVVLFALRLIKYYNQNDANTSLIELVKHKNNQIKEEAIACIKEFNVTESLDTLKLVFWNCSVDVKIAILDAIAHIGSEADIEFLNLIDKKELNFSVKSKALSSINIISPESIMPSKGIQDESKYKIPNDITEAIAKMHAEKHAEITGERDVEHFAEETTEEHASHNMADMTLTKEEFNDIGEMEKEEEKKPDVGAYLSDTYPIEDINISAEKEALKLIHEIEVISEEVILDEEPTQYNSEEDSWEIAHLDFLPIVVEEERTEMFQEAELDSASLSEKLFDIPVVYKEIKTSKKSKLSIEDDLGKQKAPFLDEFDISELAFLPIVVDSVSTVEDAQSERLADKGRDVLEIMVEYDEVLFELPENPEQKTIFNQDLEFDLEPSHEFKSLTIPEVYETTENRFYDRYNNDDIRNAFVIYEEVTHEKDEHALGDIEVIEPFVFSGKLETENYLEMQTRDEEAKENEVELPIENEQFLQRIVDDLIAFDSKPPAENTQIDDSYINPDWDLDEDQLEFIPVSFEKDEELPNNYIKIEKNQGYRNDDELDIPKASIPKAIFGDIEFEASTRQLLNDLEEMGDQREIPFLKELLVHEKYDMFKKRINTIIDTFNHTQDTEKIDNELQPFSVFQDLFRTCDVEAKLILLNEVVAVGDEKELRFLEELTKDDSPEIRKKALEALKELRYKLGRNEENSNTQASIENEVSQAVEQFEQVDEPYGNPNDIFDLNFDLSEDLDADTDEKKKTDEEQKSVHYGSFFGQICTFSNKILEKLNG